ncbi:sensor domain-containing protein [Actinoplanes sp. M2I2]|uniref:sensor domain-containing protein n=1 Tax=Actinoplanes sp. M2I2 TaxID=1734444 RepID=UPI0035B4A3D4
MHLRRHHVLPARDRGPERVRRQRLLIHPVRCERPRRPRRGRSLSGAGAAGLSLAVVWIGVPLLVLALNRSRTMAAAERERAAAVLGAPMPAPVYRTGRLTALITRPALRGHAAGRRPRRGAPRGPLRPQPPHPAVLVGPVIRSPLAAGGYPQFLDGRFRRAVRLGRIGA